MQVNYRMAKKRVLKWMCIGALSFFILLGCDEEPMNPPDDFKLWINLQDSRIVTDSPVVVPFEWVSFNESDFYVNVYLRLHDPGDLLLKGLAGPTLINARYAGNSTIQWDGRMPAVDVSSGRRMPVVPGYYSLRLYEFDNLNKPSAAIQIVANGWDTDSDGISDAVEDENNGVGGQSWTPIFDHNGIQHYLWFVSSDINQPPTIPVTILQPNDLYANRGTHDYSIASDLIRNPVPGSNASIHNGLRVADASTGYYYFVGDDPPDSDNWGILQTLNVLEAIGREWNRLHPSEARVGSGDISLAAGGFWSDHPGGTHQKGLNIDLRYMRSNHNQELGFNFDSEPYSSFSVERTTELINLYTVAGAVEIIVDYRSGIVPTSIIVVDNPPSDHGDHFHVTFPDPDGSGN